MATTSIQRKKAEELTPGQTETNILEIGEITPLKAKESMFGLMVDFTVENGKTT
jgi:hypothetical protein